MKAVRIDGRVLLVRENPFLKQGEVTVVCGAMKAEGYQHGVRLTLFGVYRNRDDALVRVRKLERRFRETQFIAHYANIE